MNILGRNLQTLYFFWQVNLENVACSLKFADKMCMQLQSYRIIPKTVTRIIILGMNTLRKNGGNCHLHFPHLCTFWGDNVLQTGNTFSLYILYFLILVCIRKQQFTQFRLYFLFGFFFATFRPTRESFIWRHHHCWWRAAKFDLCSALMAIEQ